jgi:hypothetical protein
MCTRAFLPVCPLLLAAALSHAATPLAHAPGAGGDAILHWQRDRYALAELPAGLPRTTRSALESYGPWAAENGYKLHLNERGDVVLLSRATKRPKRELGLIEKTDAYLDLLLAAEESPSSAAGQDGAFPLVLIQAKNQGDYAALVDHVASMEPYLSSWARSGKRDAGFVLERPLCAAWMEDPPGVEEWSPDNELIHRMARLRLLRCFGQLPNWVTLGVAWAAEDTISRGIYCFPYRDGFVGVGEHSSWSKTLKRFIKKRDDVPFDLVSEWRRGTWNQEAAYYAFGIVRFLERVHPGALAPFLKELQATYADKSIERFPDGSWKTRPNYQVSNEDQTALLEERLGESVFEEMAKFFRKGMPEGKRKRR